MNKHLDEINDILRLAGIKKSINEDPQTQELTVYKDATNPNAFYFKKGEEWVNPESDEHQYYYNYFVNQLVNKAAKEKLQSLPPGQTAPELQTPNTDYSDTAPIPSAPTPQTPTKKISINLRPEIS